MLINCLCSFNINHQWTDPHNSHENLWVIQFVNKKGFVLLHLECPQMLIIYTIKSSVKCICWIQKTLKIYLEFMYQVCDQYLIVVLVPKVKQKTENREFNAHPDEQQHLQYYFDYAGDYFPTWK